MAASLLLSRLCHSCGLLWVLDMAVPMSHKTHSLGFSQLGLPLHATAGHCHRWEQGYQVTKSGPLLLYWGSGGKRHNGTGFYGITIGNNAETKFRFSFRFRHYTLGFSWWVSLDPEYESGEPFNVEYKAQADYWETRVIAHFWPGSLGCMDMKAGWLLAMVYSSNVTSLLGVMQLLYTMVTTCCRKSHSW